MNNMEKGGLFSKEEMDAIKQANDMHTEADKPETSKEDEETLRKGARALLKIIIGKGMKKRREEN
jgi:hypothetical protein